MQIPALALVCDECINVAISNSEHSGTIAYTYDAVGMKLRKVASDGNVTTTDYAGNFVYKDGNLEFMHTAEGYAEPNASGGFDYIYQYKDHLGNVRLAYLDVDHDGTVTLSEIREENNYYPFGLKHKGTTTWCLPFHYQGMIGSRR